MTKYYEQAKIWANRLGREYGTNGIISEFEFDEYAYEDESLKVLIFEKYNEAWLDFVVLNRSNRKQIHNYDIVEGPVADDKVQNRINDFLNGEISKLDFLEELKWHDKTHQIGFCTIASLAFLKNIIGGKLVSIYSHIGEPIVEKLMIDFNFDDKTAANKFFSSNTFSKLADTSNLFFQKPWQEIYEILKMELKN